DRVGGVALAEREVLGGEAAHQRAALVAHRDRHPHQREAALERDGRAGRPLLGERGSRPGQRGQQEPGQRPRGPPQKRSLVSKLTERMVPTCTTCPKVGELTTVSMASSGGVLKTLLAWMRMDSVRGRPRSMFLTRPMFTRKVPGPMIVLRPASPNVPSAGTTKAAVLNQRAMPGSGTVIGCPVTSSRSVPFTPRATSPKSPRTRAVKGVPDWRLTSPLHTQPPRTWESGPWRSHLRPGPARSS